MLFLALAAFPPVSGLLEVAVGLLVGCDDFLDIDLVAGAVGAFAGRVLADEPLALSDFGAGWACVLGGLAWLLLVAALLLSAFWAWVTREALFSLGAGDALGSRGVLLLAAFLLLLKLFTSQ
ncbi:MAG: hypothetical protein RQ868_10000 [Meiothermus sp.]|uniref:hypothetical protein n=1 Tax=Meiothermus sp. TaxID=1955249 RepID=UPI0028CF8D86|nr:hypothetical protein [Meiothermus sp.]MDT7920909.1 hypothetical protein [Meiothermus sp.]